MRGRVNFRNLSRYCEYSERTIARQYRASFNWPDFHQKVINAVQSTPTEMLSVQDASFIPKSGKKTFGLGRFFNGCASRAERGLEISTLALVDVQRRCAFTLAVAQTPPNNAAEAAKAEQEETRMDFYVQQLRQQRHRLPASVKYHCADGFYAKNKYVDEVVSLNLDIITKLRCDANCLFLYDGPHPKRRGRRRKFDGKVNFQDLRRFHYLGTMPDEPSVHLYTAIVWHVSLNRKLRIVVLLNCKHNDKLRYVVLASTDLSLDGHKLVEFYILRFQIEFLFRDSKQFTGLTDCQARDEAALNFHFNVSLATLNLVRAEELLASSLQSPQVFSMASHKQSHFNSRLLDLFILSLELDPTWVKNHPAYDKLKAYGVIAA